LVGLAFAARCFPRANLTIVIKGRIDSPDFGAGRSSGGKDCLVGAAHGWFTVAQTAAPRRELRVERRHSRRCLLRRRRIATRLAGLAPHRVRLWLRHIQFDAHRFADKIFDLVHRIEFGLRRYCLARRPVAKAEDRSRREPVAFRRGAGLRGGRPWRRRLRNRRRGWRDVIDRGRRRFGDNRRIIKSRLRAGAKLCRDQVRDRIPSRNGRLRWRRRRHGELLCRRRRGLRYWRRLRYRANRSSSDRRRRNRSRCESWCG